MVWAFHLQQINTESHVAQLTIIRLNSAEHTRELRKLLCNIQWSDSIAPLMTKQAFYFSLYGADLPLRDSRMGPFKMQTSCSAPQPTAGIYK